MVIVHFHRNRTVRLGCEAGPAPLHQRIASQGWGVERTASRLFYTQCFHLTACTVREYQQHPVTAHGTDFVALSWKLRWRVRVLWQCPSVSSSWLFFHCAQFHCSLSLLSAQFLPILKTLTDLATFLSAYLFFVLHYKVPTAPSSSNGCS